MYLVALGSEGSGQGWHWGQRTEGRIGDTPREYDM